MPRKRTSGKRKKTLTIPAGMLEWLNGKPLAQCDDETRAESYFWWSLFDNGITGVVAFAQAQGLMPKRIPPEVRQRMEWEHPAGRAD